MKIFSRIIIYLFLLVVAVLVLSIGCEDLYTLKKPIPPKVTLEEASSITVNSAILSGTVNANGLSTLVIFVYGLDENYGNSITANQSPIEGINIKNVSASLNDLLVGTTYHYRIKAENSLGITYGDDLTFTTLGQVPFATTLEATNLANNSAKLKGTVNANELNTVVTFEYGLIAEYGSSIVAGQSPVSGNTNINVNVDITSLSPGTEYHFRVKAENELGTSYGDDLTFTTLGQVPTVVTSAATSITITGANLTGTVNANHLNTTVTFEYGLTAEYGSSVTATQSPVSGNTDMNVSADITDLNPGTTYHFRVKAENELGSAYSEDKKFRTHYDGFTGTVTDVEGNIYSTIGIGSQLWMAENLRTTKYNDGTSIPNVTDDLEWGALSTSSFCWFSNDSTNYSIPYGALYNWFAVQTDKLCPVGWHVGNEVDWQILADYLGGAENAGGKLKEAGFDHWSSPNTGATNESGFTALPSGRRDVNGAFNRLGTHFHTWIIDEVQNSRYLLYGWNGLEKTSASSKYGFSIRCVYD